MFRVRIKSCESNFTVTVLSTTTRLTNEFRININIRSKSFFVCYLWCTNVSFYFEFTK